MLTKSRSPLVLLLLILLPFLLTAAPEAARADIGSTVVQQAEKKIEDAFKVKLGEMLGAGSPLFLDQHSALPAVPPLTDFHPKLLPSSTAADLARPLPAGDFFLPVTGYCSEFSVHAPGRGLGYKLARIQGKQAASIGALVVRGNFAGISPYTLNAEAWRIEAGVPLSQWPEEDQALVRRLIPERANGLEGDYLQQFRKIYEDFSTQRVMGIKIKIPLPKFDDLLLQLGDVGRTVLRLEAAHKVLTDRTLSAERLPDMLYDAGDGSPRVLPPSEDGSPSPWTEIQKGVYGRLIILDGNMGSNRFEFRVTPEALRTSTAFSRNAAPRMSYAGFTPQAAAPLAGYVSLITVMGLTPYIEGAGALSAGTGGAAVPFIAGGAVIAGGALFIGYSIDHPAQALMVLMMLSHPVQLTWDILKNMPPFVASAPVLNRPDDTAKGDSAAGDEATDDKAAGDKNESFGDRLQDVLDGATPGDVGKSRQYDKPGDLADANKDFDKLAGSNPIKERDGIRSTELPDGTTISVRPYSGKDRSGSPTVQVDKPTGKPIKIRYGR